MGLGGGGWLRASEHQEKEGGKERRKERKKREEREENAPLCIQSQERKYTVTLDVFNGPQLLYVFYRVPATTPLNSPTTACPIHPSDPPPHHPHHQPSVAMKSLIVIIIIQRCDGGEDHKRNMRWR